MKNTRRTLFIIGLMALLLTGSGCLNGSSSTAYNEGYGFVTAKIYPITTGGNTIYIYQNDQHVTFTAELTNNMYKGAKNVKLVADNYNPRAIDFEPVNLFPIEDFNDYDITTNLKHLQIIEQSIKVSSIDDRPYTTNLRFHLCAEATTFLETQVCVGPQNAANAMQGTCTPGTVTLNRGQGAPIAITSIQQSDSGNSITLHIKAVNKAKGLAYDSQSQSKCGFIGQDEVGTVQLTVARLSEHNMNCRRTERLGYTEKYQASAGATFVCTIMKDVIGMDIEDVARPHMLHVELKYNYYQELPSQNIIIKNAPGYSSGTTGNP